MSPEPETPPPDWKLVARAYRARLHSVCWFAAFVIYVGACIGAAKLLQVLHVSESWAEVVFYFAWLPLGAAAWWLKNALEDLADRGIDY